MGSQNHSNIGSFLHDRILPLLPMGTDQQYFLAFVSQ